MGDMSTTSCEKVKKHLETTVSRKTIVKKYKKNSKSVKRKNRRKRSKKAYFNMLKKERIFRGTEELCNSIQEFSVIDMDMKPMCDINKLPEEITEWQKQEQIAYWKSRAISFEIENKILRQHLRNVYAQQIEYYEKSKGWQQLPSNDNLKEKKNKNNGKVNSVEGNNKNIDKKLTANSSGGPCGSGSKKDPVNVIPKEPTGKNRLQEMEKIYGEMAPKIMGMETAIELNYQRLVQEGSPGYWPNIPLKL